MANNLGRRAREGKGKVERGRARRDKDRARARERWMERDGKKRKTSKREERKLEVRGRNGIGGGDEWTERQMNRWMDRWRDE